MMEFEGKKLIWNGKSPKATNNLYKESKCTKILFQVRIHEFVKYNNRTDLEINGSGLKLCYNQGFVTDKVN